MSTEKFHVFPTVTKRASEPKAEVRAPGALPTSPSCLSNATRCKRQVSLPQIYSKIAPAYWNCKEGLATATSLGIERSGNTTHVGAAQPHVNVTIAQRQNHH